ncbi:MAG: hypothetical protein NC180_12505 [Muribaculaceae bacterium]|nr:hypothetical protein [Muribaculaceae bacterium]
MKHKFYCFSLWIQRKTAGRTKIDCGVPPDKVSGSDCNVPSDKVSGSDCGVPSDGDERDYGGNPYM